MLYVLKCIFIYFRLAGAVRRRFKSAMVSEVIELTANWLKDAPSREKKRNEVREKILRDYEEDDDTEPCSY